MPSSLGTHAFTSWVQVHDCLQTTVQKNAVTQLYVGNPVMRHNRLGRGGGGSAQEATDWIQILKVKSLRLDYRISSAPLFHEGGLPHYTTLKEDGLPTSGAQNITKTQRPVIKPPDTLALALSTVPYKTRTMQG